MRIERVSDRLDNSKLAVEEIIDSKLEVVIGKVMSVDDNMSAKTDRAILEIKKVQRSIDEQLERKWVAMQLKLETTLGPLMTEY